uniref:Uncharacterized protein n=1 Tax=Thermosporothrix sp. COM3 TaxID=2490863 RepID=A0A455SSZ7_9CHLR|nr:hypothetical protein KTC_40160 [Thermosporothrix sp. COM3]
MGCMVDLLVARRHPGTISRQSIEALFSALIEEQIVTLPCALLSGDLEINSSLSIAHLNLHLAPQIQKPIVAEGKEIIVHYHGKEPTALLHALHDLSYEKSNLCFWFAGFHPDFIARHPSFAKMTDVLLFALTTPHMLHCIDVTTFYSSSTYYVRYGLRAMGHKKADLQGTRLLSLLQQSFGAEIIVDYDVLP